MYYWRFPLYGKQRNIFLMKWAGGNSKPYESWGNGSAMRSSPTGWAFDTIIDKKYLFMLLFQSGMTDSPAGQ
jgi:ADP-ribosylglycohydrolase